jgi:hypothetical protein
MTSYSMRVDVTLGALHPAKRVSVTPVKCRPLNARNYPASRQAFIPTLARQWLGKCDGYCSHTIKLGSIIPNKRWIVIILLVPRVIYLKDTTT